MKLRSPFGYWSAHDRLDKYFKKGCNLWNRSREDQNWKLLEDWCNLSTVVKAHRESYPPCQPLKVWSLMNSQVPEGIQIIDPPGVQWQWLGAWSHRFDEPYLPSQRSWQLNCFHCRLALTSRLVNSEAPRLGAVMTTDMATILTVWKLARGKYGSSLT